MRFRPYFPAWLTGLTLFCSAPQAFADVVITNGGFETPAVALSPGFLDVGVGGEPGGFGWTVLPRLDFNQESVDLVRAGTQFFGAAAFEGNQYLDLDGVNPGGVFQTFGTVASTLYHLNFAYANNPSLGATLPTAHAELRVLNADTLADLIAPIALSHSGSTASDLNWTASGDITFVPNGARTMLLFRSTDTTVPDPANPGGPPIPSLGGIFLDGVVVEGLPAPTQTPSVPEPASLVLAVLGAAPVAVWIRRVRKGRAG